MGKLHQLPAIDGLRAIAVLAVVAYHSGLPVPAGFVGVDVFFVISGYLITRLLYDEVLGTDRIDFMAFYARRARRILPALALVTVATLGMSTRMLSPIEQQQTAKSAAAAFLFAANWFFYRMPSGYFDVTPETMPLLHLWSLGVEEQFYLVWPFVLLLARKRPVAALATLTVLSLALAEWWIWRDPNAAFYQMPSRAWELALGGLVALRAPVVPKGSVWVGLAVVLLACCIPFLHFPGLGAVPAVAGSVLLIAAIHGGERSPVLESRPMVAIGLWSYSIYLWHWPLLIFGKPLLNGRANTGWLMVLTFALAFLTYRWIESPVRRAWTRRPRMTVVAASVLVAAGAIVAMAQNRRALNAENAEIPSVYAMGCDAWYRNADLNPCVFGPVEAPNTVVIIGDSVGMQWFPIVASIFVRPQWRLIALTKSSCPMIDEPFYYPLLKREFTECDQWRQAALKYVAALRPDAVILGSTDTYGFTQAQWTEGTARLLARISPSVGMVRILRSTPQRSGLAPHNEKVYRWTKAAALRFPNVAVVDMNDLVCPHRHCRATLGGRLVFRDEEHLSAPFVLSLREQLAVRLGIAAPLKGSRTDR